MSTPVGLPDLPHELQTYLVEFLDPRALVAVQTALPAEQARERARQRLIQIRQALRQAQQATDRQMEAIYGDMFGRSGC